MAEPVPLVTVREVRDFYGRRYRVGESPQQIMGRHRRWMLWLPWLAMAAVSVLQYGYGMLVPSLQRVHGWTLPEAMSVLAVWAVFQAGVAFPVVWLRERHAIAPSRIMLAGGLLCLAGLVGLAHAGGLVTAVLTYGVLGGTGAGLVYATCVTTVSKWYPESRGLRIGVVTGAFAYGCLPFVAVVGLGTSDGGGVGGGSLTGLLDVTGVVLAVVVVGAGVLFRDPPQDWWPAHLDPQAWAVDKTLNRSLPGNIPAARQYSTGEALHTGVLPVMYAILVSVTAVSLLGIAYLATFATDMGLGPAAVALCVGGLALVNGAGRSFASRASDRLGRRRTLTAVLTVEGLAQFGLVAAGETGHPAGLFACAVIAGLGGGAFYPLFGSLVLEYFGERRALQNYGVVYSAKLFGAVLGIGVASLLVTTYGYGTAFVAAGFLGLVSAALTGLLRKPGRPTVPLPPPSARRSTLVGS
ncbi:MAG: OFA family MFS transporter [Actinomycetes bacterium]